MISAFVEQSTDTTAVLDPDEAAEIAVEGEDKVTAEAVAEVLTAALDGV